MAAYTFLQSAFTEQHEIDIVVMTTRSALRNRARTRTRPETGPSPSSPVRPRTGPRREAPLAQQQQQSGGKALQRKGAMSPGGQKAQ